MPLKSSDIQTELDRSGRHLLSSPHTSYSGADYHFWVHVPVESSLGRRQQLVHEIQDEIWEMEARIRQFEQRIPNAMQSLNSAVIINASDHADTLRRMKEVLDKLRQAKQMAEKDASTIRTIQLDTVQTISYQSHMDKQAVRALGHAWPKGYTRGPRLVAGSIIFTAFREHPLIPIIDAFNQGNDPRVQFGIAAFSSRQPGDSYDLVPSSAVPDQLPPLHISGIAVNEMGNAATLTLYGVEFLNDGQVMSIQDIITENTLSFVAMDYDPMRTLDTRGVLNIPAFDRIATVSSLLQSPVAAARRVRRSLPF